MTQEIDNMKEPLNHQINSIKQEKEGLVRELERIHHNTRDIINQSSSLFDKSQLPGYNDMRESRNHSTKRGGMNISTQKRFDPSLSIQKAYNNTLYSNDFYANKQNIPQGFGSNLNLSLDETNKTNYSENTFNQTNNS